MSNSTDYIKRKDVAELIRTYCIDLIDHGKDNVEVTEFNADIQKKINEIPAADVVETGRLRKHSKYSHLLKRFLQVE